MLDIPSVGLDMGGNERKQRANRQLSALYSFVTSTNVLLHCASCLHKNLTEAECLILHHAVRPELHYGNGIAKKVFFLSFFQIRLMCAHVCCEPAVSVYCDQHYSRI